MNGCVYRTEDNKCEFYSDYGKGIVSYCDFDDCEEKKLSNADRIRHSSDEELAEWISNEIWKAFAQGAGNPFFNQEEAVKLEKQEWLDWLKEEAKE